MAQRHFFFEPGINRTEYLALPVCGGWLGQVRVTMSTSGVSNQTTAEPRQMSVEADETWENQWNLAKVMDDASASGGKYLLQQSSYEVSKQITIPFDTNKIIVRLRGNGLNWKFFVDGVEYGDYTVAYTTWTDHEIIGDWKAGTYKFGLMPVNVSTNSLYLDTLTFSGQENVPVPADPTTIHEWTYIWPNAPRGRNYYRRTNVSSANSYKDGIMVPERRYERWLFQGESILKLRYTSESRISVLYETDRKYIPYPSLDQNPPASANTEKAAPGDPGELNGVFWWRPTP